MKILSEYLWQEIMSYLPSMDLLHLSQVSTVWRKRSPLKVIAQLQLYYQEGREGQCGLADTSAWEWFTMRDACISGEIPYLRITLRALVGVGQYKILFQSEHRKVTNISITRAGAIQYSFQSGKRNYQPRLFPLIRILCKSKEWDLSCQLLSRIFAGQWRGQDVTLRRFIYYQYKYWTTNHLMTGKLQSMPLLAPQIHDRYIMGGLLARHETNTQSFRYFANLLEELLRAYPSGSFQRPDILRAVTTSIEKSGENNWKELLQQIALASAYEDEEGVEGVEGVNSEEGNLAERRERKLREYRGDLGHDLYHLPNLEGMICESWISGRRWNRILPLACAYTGNLGAVGEDDDGINKHDRRVGIAYFYHFLFDAPRNRKEMQSEDLLVEPIRRAWLPPVKANPWKKDILSKIENDLQIVNPKKRWVQWLKDQSWSLSEDVATAMTELLERFDGDTWGLQAFYESLPPYHPTGIPSSVGTYPAHRLHAALVHHQLMAAMDALKNGGWIGLTSLLRLLYDTPGISNMKFAMDFADAFDRILHRT
jgi:hypothetical protein